MACVRPVRQKYTQRICLFIKPRHWSLPHQFTLPNLEPNQPPAGSLLWNDPRNPNNIHEKSFVGSGTTKQFLKTRKEIPWMCKQYEGNDVFLENNMRLKAWYCFWDVLHLKKHMASTQTYTSLQVEIVETGSGWLILWIFFRSCWFAGATK